MKTYLFKTEYSFKTIRNKEGAISNPPSLEKICKDYKKSGAKYAIFNNCLILPAKEAKYWELFLEEKEGKALLKTYMGNRSFWKDMVQEGTTPDNTVGFQKNKDGLTFKVWRREDLGNYKLDGEAFFILDSSECSNYPAVPYSEVFQELISAYAAWIEKTVENTVYHIYAMEAI